MRMASKDDVADNLPRAKAEFDGDAINKEFALVLMGSNAVVYHERPEAQLDERKRILSLQAFNAWLANRFTEMRCADGKIKVLPLGKAWLQWNGRRQYHGIEFHPDPNNAPGTPRYLNLWSGFSVEPAIRSDPRRYSVFRDHLFNNVCQGSEALNHWVFGFFAHLVQRPRERPDVAIVLRGKMGSGKTKVGEVIGRLFEQHYFLVDDPRYVTGQFNAHMSSCLLLQADEAVWAGDKKAEGRLKGLVTSTVQQIEAKGVDPIRLRNYLRLLLTSNESWVVPAGKDERRFAVLDVNSRCAKNIEYFSEMEEELQSGGLSYLLRDLLDFDLSDLNLRQIPHTLALLEQKIASLDSVDSWWLGRLHAGAPTQQHSEWSIEVPTAALFNDYVGISERIGYRRRSSETSFGMALKRLVPTFKKRRRSQSDPTAHLPRVWCYVLPGLAEARDMLEEAMGQPVPWTRDTSDSENSL
jgi:Family of unknown function (DUF5906)